MTAIVFNCAYNGLNIVQTLGRRGIDVYAVDSFRNIGTTSKYATYVNSPNPTESEEGFIDQLLTMGREFDEKPVLIPTNDHWVSAASKHRDRLSELYHPCFSDWSTVDLLLDKRSFSNWALSNGYPVPDSWTHKDVETVSDDAFPIIAKRGDGRYRPDFVHRSTVTRTIQSFFGREPNPDQLTDDYQQVSDIRLEVLDNRTDLDEFLADNDGVLEKFTFEEYVRGISDRMYTVGIYANEGTVKGLFSGRKVRGYPPDIGDCKVGQVEDVPPHLKETVIDMCEDLGYHGIAEFEFKRDSETGEFYLIEVNPRSWSWVGITPSCGVDLPSMAYADLKGIESVEYTESSVPDKSVKWVKASEDLLNVLLFYRRSYPEWSGGPLAWRRSIRSEEVVYAEGSPRDPIPLLYSIALILRRLAITTKKSIFDSL